MLKLRLSHVFPLGLLFLITVLCVIASADQRYVRPNIDVPLRRGQGNKYKILKLVKSGELVELLKEGNSWAKIQLSNGTIGWLPKQFLSLEAPPLQLVKILRKDNERLQEREKQLTLELNKLKELQVNTGGELSTCIARRDKFEADYIRLQEDTSDIVAINKKMAETQKQIDTVQAAMHTVELQNNELKRKTAVTWFLAGGGVLFAGWIIGLITCRSRRRRSSLL